MSLKSIIKRVANLIFPPPVVKAEIHTLSQNELLCGRNALITGGTSGIGLEIAKSFLNAGATVVITGRNEERLESACKKIISINNEWEKRIFSIVMDVSNVNELEVIFNRIITIVGKIDILVNNAGIDYGHINTCDEFTFNAIMNTNIKGVFFLSRIVAKHMIEKKIKGNILNVCSSCSILPANSAYSLSKWSLRGLTEGLARMLIPYDIVVNGIAPGMTATPLVKKKNSNDDLFLNEALNKRFAIPEEISNMSVILVSNMCRLVVGDILYMTGGSGLISKEDMNYNFV